MKMKTGPALPLSAWKRQHGANLKTAKKEEEERPFISAETHGLTSMFVPTRTGGNDFFEIITRKQFLDENIDQWLKWHAYRGMTIALGIASLWLFTINPYFGVAVGLLAGWSFGWYWRWSEALKIIKNRDLLEAV